MSDENLYLAHHGVKGQKWGVRRYQNEDGSLTEAGKKRQFKRDYKQAKKDIKRAVKTGDIDRDGTNRTIVSRKINKEIDNDKDVKEYRRFNGRLQEVLMEASKNSGIDISGKTIILPADVTAAKNQKRTAAQESSRKIGRKYINEFAGATLRDINAKDTEGGRAYVEKLLYKSGYDDMYIQ